MGRWYLELLLSCSFYIFLCQLLRFSGLKRIRYDRVFFVTLFLGLFMWKKGRVQDFYFFYLLENLVLVFILAFFGSFVSFIKQKILIAIKRHIR